MDVRGISNPEILVFQSEQQKTDIDADFASLLFALFSTTQNFTNTDVKDTAILESSTKESLVNDLNRDSALFSKNAKVNLLESVLTKGSSVEEFINASKNQLLKVDVYKETEKLSKLMESIFEVENKDLNSKKVFNSVLQSNLSKSPELDTTLNQMLKVLERNEQDKNINVDDLISKFFNDKLSQKPSINPDETIHVKQIQINRTDNKSTEVTQSEQEDISLPQRSINNVYTELVSKVEDYKLNQVRKASIGQENGNKVFNVKNLLQNFNLDELVSIMATTGLEENEKLNNVNQTSTISLINELKLLLSNEEINSLNGKEVTSDLQSLITKASDIERNNVNINTNTDVSLMSESKILYLQKTIGNISTNNKNEVGKNPIEVNTVSVNDTLETESTNSQETVIRMFDGDVVLSSTSEKGIMNVVDTEKTYMIKQKNVVEGTEKPETNISTKRSDIGSNYKSIFEVNKNVNNSELLQTGKVVSLTQSQDNNFDKIKDFPQQYAKSYTTNNNIFTSNDVLNNQTELIGKKLLSAQGKDSDVINKLQERIKPIKNDVNIIESASLIQPQREQKESKLNNDFKVILEGSQTTVRDGNNKVKAEDKGLYKEITASHELHKIDTIKPAEALKNEVNQIVSTIQKSDDILEVVLNRFKAIRLPQVTEMKVKLNPEELGEITVKVSLDKGEINGHIIAERRDVFNIIQGQLEHLKQDLRSNNVNLNNLSLNLTNDNNQGNQNSPNSGSFNHDGRRGSGHFKEQLEKSSSSEKEEGLNIFA